MELKDINVLQDDEEILLVPTNNKRKADEQNKRTDKVPKLRIILPAEESEYIRIREANIQKRDATFRDLGIPADCLINSLDSPKNEMIVQVADIFLEKEKEVIGGWLWDGEVKAKFTIKLNDYEKFDQEFHKHEVIKIKKFKLSEIAE